MQLYMISFPQHLSEKVYVGVSSKGAARRFREHCASKKDYPIAQAIRKYGPENAILTVIAERSTWDEIYALEQAAIAACNSKAPAGYNLTDGGPGCFGLPASPERKRKISEANRGRKASDETRRKISEANRGRDTSIQVAAMREANRGRKLSDEHAAKLREVWTGRKHSEAAKLKMSEAAKRRDNSAKVEAMRVANTGRKMSAECLAKRAATLAEKKCNPLR